MTDQTQYSWRAEATAGLVDILPLLAAACPFALLLGALAVQNGLSPAEITLMSFTVYAGASQFIAVDQWTVPVAIGLIVGTTALVNLRHVIMGAALAPYLSGFRPWQRWAFVSIHADETWAMAIRRGRSTTGLTPAYVGGMIIPFYLNWPFCTALGASLGNLVESPERYGIDFAFPAMFTVLIVGFWHGRRETVVIAVSAAVAIAAKLLLPGVWYIFLGGITGIVAGAMAWRPDGTDRSETPS
ncbi:MAG: AzlC family ABC transporter permease [Alphaproteobacteria bacterium]